MRTRKELQSVIRKPEYDFLRTHPLLSKDSLLFLGVSGSIGYGMDNENSDVDLRGVALNTKEEILLGTDFEQVVDVDTDTTIYSFKKIVQLLISCNPNTIELLGLNPEHYLYMSDIGQELIQNADMFLSKKAAYSFGGYANQQLRRLANKSARQQGQAERERHVLNSINHAKDDFPHRYHLTEDGRVDLYLDDSKQDNPLKNLTSHIEGWANHDCSGLTLNDFSLNDSSEKDIYMDISLKHYPLRDYLGMMSEMQSIVRSYDKIGRRNKKAIGAGRLAKHMAHLVRLFLSSKNILKYGQIRTYMDQALDSDYRGIAVLSDYSNEHDLLMDIRNGVYLLDNNVPSDDFMQIVDGLEQELRKDTANTRLPDEPDFDRIHRFVMKVNEAVVKA